MNRAPQRAFHETAPIVAIAFGFVLLLFSSTAQAEIHEHDGAYVRAGIGLGFVDPDADVDVSPGASFALGGGYHVTSWLAAEVDLSVIAGAKVDVAGDPMVTGVGFTIGGKLYPLGAADADVPEWLDPYAIFGIGGGYLDVEDLDDDSSFLIRFAFGFDMMLWDNVGAYVQGGYDIATEDLVDGVGQLVVGGIYRFE